MVWSARFAALQGEPPLKKQAKLDRFLKPAAALQPADLQFVQVQSVKSRHVPVKPGRFAQQSLVAVQSGVEQQSLGAVQSGVVQEEQLVAVGAASDGALVPRHVGGTPLQPLGDRRGVAGGAPSNRLELGVARRRQDITCHEGLAICSGC